MREVVDPFKGKKYSEILESLSGDDRAKYYERPHPLIKVPGTASAIWAPAFGRWVV